MRKKQKEQVENFIKLLRQAHGEIQRKIGRGELTTVSELLEECQQGAIALGNLIESTEGEGAPTIPVLEEYCEQVYQVYGKITDGQSGNRDKLRKVRELCGALQESLALIEKSVCNDIRVRKTVVFLPYKASMWDSLESVWKAADEDPECDAYVIPIPYYDKNPDGSFREEHYEGNDYPDDVPVVRYDAFDFEEIRPDMIFIHNPYDECNFVTSVHPFFYSVNLKKFTDMLVYIPYFILDEVDPENKEAIEGIEHFCLVPGVFHADKVIVQSENMRRIYIEVLTKEAGENSRNLWEEKILGLGSPKFDKIDGGSKEKTEMPEEWRKLIHKPDGSRKKIILYNTSVAAMLKHSEKMLEKMGDVFQIFEENREEVTLWWRPHPLIKATIESMRPQLWRAYGKIVEKYRQEGWGIYDDSPDLSRALKLSDAYYGDASSLVQLCQSMGKPVMLQNVKYLSGREKRQD